MFTQLKMHYLGITDRSSEVFPGCIFVAIKGARADGHNYIAKAIKNGAILVVAEDVEAVAGLDQSSVMVVQDSKAFLQECVRQFYRAPRHLIGVTGTNGKTSVTFFCHQLLSLLGLKSASIGTLGLISNVGLSGEAKLTTPDTVEMHRMLDALVASQVQYASIEVSSHALDQRRAAGLRFEVVAFTSFSHDHLDYHSSLDTYLQAKLKIFRLAKEVAVVSADMPCFDLVRTAAHESGIRVVSYNKSAACSVSTRLVGEFQKENLLCAALIVSEVTGTSYKQVSSLLPHLISVPGRMEQVDDLPVFIDFAHTPEALQVALLALRPLTLGRLIVVFGCGGERDSSKRRVMGDIARSHADVVIVTDDNPRQEDPASIRKEIMLGCPNAVEVEDRKQAIAYAVDLMTDRDVLLVAGKGHELYQIVGTQKVKFDERVVVRECYS